MVVARGYKGSKSGFRAIVSRLRPRRAAEAYLRRAVLPGEEAQVDWAHFGKITVGRAERPLFAFVMVLPRRLVDGRSRRDRDGHQAAGSCPRRGLMAGALAPAISGQKGRSPSWPSRVSASARR